MRLFVALTPPADVVAELAAAVRPVSAAAPGLRWTPTAQWHLTLAFLGEVDERRRTDLTECLGRTTGRSRPLQLAFRGAGRFDHRVFWAGVGGDTAGLRGLADAAGAAARRAGIPVPDRAYRPHLTLARAAGEADLCPLVAALAGFTGASWPASELQLVHSTLGAGPDGRARHVPVESWPLWS